MTARFPSRAIAAAALGIVSLSGCAHREVAAPVAVAVPVAPPPRPVLAGEYGSVVPPPRGLDGRYMTINAGADAERTMWHVRAALNVAAIGCRALEDAAITPAYNALLKNEKAELAKANTAVQASFRKGGGDWQSAHDRYMTRLYNFFAMPAAKAGFCAAAREVAPEAAVATPATFATFAAGALPRLEAPFIAVYAAIDDWKVQTAAWDQRYGPNATQLAATAPAAAAPVMVAAAPVAAMRAATAAPVAAAPQLRYADIGTMLAWQPPLGPALASR